MVILSKPVLRLDYRILATMIQSHKHLSSHTNYTKILIDFWYNSTSEFVVHDKERTNDMTIADVVKVLDGKLMAGDGASPRAVGAVVANDLMSDVLLYDADDILLLTSLASDQAIRTAHIVGAMGVVVHNAKPLSQTMIEVANNLGIPLVSSPLAKYEACVRIHDALTQEK